MSPIQIEIYESKSCPLDPQAPIPWHLIYLRYHYVINIKHDIVSLPLFSVPPRFHLHSSGLYNHWHASRVDANSQVLSCLLFDWDDIWEFRICYIFSTKCCGTYYIDRQTVLKYLSQFSKKKFNTLINLVLKYLTQFIFDLP